MKMTIQSAAHFGRRVAGFSKRSQQRLKVGHQNRRGDSLAADVGDREHQSPIGKLNDIVVVAADPACGNAYGSEFQSVAFRQLAWKQRALHLEREAQLGFLAGKLPPARLQLDLNSIERYEKHGGGCRGPEGQTPRNKRRSLNQTAAQEQ